MSRLRLIPVNDVDGEFMERLALCLEERFLLTCGVERILRLPQSSLNPARKQLFLNTLVTKVTAHGGEGLALAVTAYDLYKTSHQFVFGDANEEHRVAAVSLHRLRSDYYGERADANLLFQRTLKEAVHNLGHALGLKHCFNARCAMHYSNSIYDTDNKVSHLCEACEKKSRASR